MFTETLNVGGRIRRLTLAIPAALLIVGESALAQPLPENFEMLVDTGSAQGIRLAAGKFDEASASDRLSTRRTFDAINNRCVLLTMTREFERAREVCDEAVGIHNLRKFEVGDAAHSMRHRIQKAMALTNRGVLRAVTGELDGAREDFEAVIALDSVTGAARANLARLAAERTKLAVASRVN